MIRHFLLPVAAFVAVLGATLPAAAEVYSVEPTANSPSINFDTATGVLDISGRSAMTDSSEFYQPLLNALTRYQTATAPTTVASFKLNYIDEASSLRILDVLKKLESIQKSGSSVTVNWRYEEDDVDMEEVGADYSALTSLRFEFVEITE